MIARRIGEQESKASNHVYQIGLLARALNRTLVLPPMWKSRFGTCYRNSFSFYYHEGTFAKLDIPFIPFEVFQRWVSKRRTTPSAQIIDVVAQTSPQSISRSGNYASFLESSSTSPSKSKHNLCLQDKVPRLSYLSPPLVLSPIEPTWFLDSKRLDGFRKEALEVLNTVGADVLAVTWELRHAIFPNSEGVRLEYAPRWLDLATSVASQLGPFIAVHWRMETADPDVMPACASALVSAIKSLVEIPSPDGVLPLLGNNSSALTRSVYLATDYPLEGPSHAHSGTFRDVSDSHHAAIQILRSAFSSGEGEHMHQDDLPEGGWLRGLTLTTLQKELSALQAKRKKSTRPPDGERAVEAVVRFEDMDPGLVGILDKAILMQSAWFLSGTRTCSRQR